MPGNPSAVPLLARRFLVSKSSDGFISLIAWVSVVGVALGVLALVVVTSVINGFEDELTRVITGVNGEVILYSRGDPIQDPEVVEKKVRRAVPETQAITRSFITELMVSGPHGVAGAVIEGFDPKTVGQVTAIPERVTLGRLPTGIPAAAAPELTADTPVEEAGTGPTYEIALGAALADRIGATEGTKIRLIIPFVGSEDEPDAGLTGAPKAITAQVVGIVRMGMYEYDSKFVFASLESVQQFMHQPGKVTTFKLKLEKGSDSRVASDHLTDQFGYPFKSKDWAQLNKNLFYAIRLEKIVIGIILTVIVIVAAFNVVSTLMMMIHDKTREISILKAMGFRPGQSFRLFCLIGVGMGAVGTLVGVLLGMAMNLIISKYHFIDLPAEIYYIGFLPVVTEWTEVGLIAGTAVLIAFVATLYPAIQVSRRSPLDGLRYE